MIYCHSYLFCCSNSPDWALESPFKWAPGISSHVPTMFQGLPYFLAPQALLAYFLFSLFQGKSQSFFFFSQEALVPGESTLMDQTSCPPRRGSGKKMTHSPLQCPRKRKKSSWFFIPPQKALRWQIRGAK